mgnify:FL=1
MTTIKYTISNRELWLAWFKCQAVYYKLQWLEINRLWCTKCSFNRELENIIDRFSCQRSKLKYTAK